MAMAAILGDAELKGLGGIGEAMKLPHQQRLQKLMIEMMCSDEGATQMTTKNAEGAVLFCSIAQGENTGFRGDNRIRTMVSQIFFCSYSFFSNLGPNQAGMGSRRGGGPEHLELFCFLAHSSKKTQDPMVC
jgi:hypothetical protein